jgi:hypothetical protein
MFSRITSQNSELIQAWILSLLLALLLSTGIATAAVPTDVRGNPCELNAVYTEQAPRIDGYIDEDVWSRGVLATYFTQREPDTGELVSERTGVRILYDQDNLYFLFICGDSEPDRMVANTMRRDQTLTQDDNVEVYLDPLHDHRTVFLFATNPLGAKRDAIVTGNGQNFNGDWDGIWHVETKVTVQGWVAEMVIPLETLRFVTGENMTWGINFGRSIQRNEEATYWAPIRYTQSWQEKYHADNYGHLNGLRLLQSKRTFQIKPYALGGGDKNYAAHTKLDMQREIGADVKYGITNQLTLDLTYNTDFAQVEADDEVINLTRYNLFFPEKRDFFLEGAGTFEFSTRTAAIGSDGSDMMLFHSRNIGLHKRQVVPLYGGVRLQGKVGDYDVGVLNITSKEKTFGSGASAEVLPETNYSVVRAKQNFGQRSDIGFMFTNRVNGQRADNNQALGFDTNISLPQEFAFRGYFARTFTPGMHGSANSIATSIGRRGRLLSGFVKGFRIEKNFNPALGFMERDDVNRLTTYVAVSPRPRKWGIRSISNSAVYSYTADQAFSLLERYYNFTSTIETESNDTFSHTIYSWFLHQPIPLKITGISVPIADYRSVWQRASYSGDRSRPVSFTASSRWGDYYDGYLRSFNGSVSLKLYNRFQMRLSDRFSKMKLAGQKINTNVLSHTLSYSFSTDLFVRSTTQWNNRDERILLNFLLRYTYRPGSDFYLVYNEFYGVEEWAPEIRQRTALLKFTYLL